MDTLEINRPYRVKTGDRRFVGYLDFESANLATFRIGLNDRLIVGKKEIETLEKLSPREIETRKNGRFFTF